MKRTLFFLLLFGLPFVTFAQFAFAPEFIPGNRKLTDLSNPANFTVIGTGPTQLGASDFGADGILYGLSTGTNKLYQIDTTNASSVEIGTVLPPGGNQ